MQYHLLHRGVPVAVTDAADARALSTTLAQPLPAFEALRPAVPVWSALGATAFGAGGFADGLEFRDALGVAVPATRIDAWLADPAHVLVFVQFDSAGASVGARVPPVPHAGGNVADG